MIWLFFELIIYLINQSTVDLFIDDLIIFWINYLFNQSINCWFLCRWFDYFFELIIYLIIQSNNQSIKLLIVEN